MALNQTLAPNRTFSLEELDYPNYRKVIQELEKLVKRHDGFYLHPSKQWEYPWALERARLRPGSEILDAGSGGSIFPLYLVSQGHHVNAIDLSFPASLPEAETGPVRYAAADLTALPFTNGVFDAAFCISVIEHLPEHLSLHALGELNRVLKPGGRLMLTTDFYRDASACLYYEGPGERFPVDWNIFDEARLRRTIRQASGFEVEGELDLTVDWLQTEKEMLNFHGYPYTSVGITLVKAIRSLAALPP